MWGTKPRRIGPEKFRRNPWMDECVDGCGNSQKVAKLMGNSGKRWSMFLQKRISTDGYWFSWRIYSTKKGRIEESRRIFLKGCVQEFLSSFFTWRNLRLFGARIWSNGPEFHVCKGAFISTIFYHHSWNKVWNGSELSNAATHINPTTFPPMASDKRWCFQFICRKQT